MSSISYFSEGVNFKIPQKKIINRWIKEIVSTEGLLLKHLNFIFCSDAYLLGINQHYLSHDFYTDIITFDTSDLPQTIEGEIFISIDRVKENASSLNLDLYTEILRVMAHGVLHLMGYDDHGEDNQLIMRQKEDSCLSLLSF
jgi:rRNA maturation RNase YbeY